MTDARGNNICEPREFTVPINDLELHCTTLGVAATVVLGHAGGARRTVWRPLAARVAPRPFRTIAVDQRGHGDTGGPSVLRLEGE
jgi:pimeloyl-ACP methyl ester carboxylesterase